MVTMIPVDEALEANAVDILTTVRFLYPDEQYPHDETTIRAMLVLGGSVEQIKESIAIAAINTNVDRESKTRYANGVLRNLMNPRPLPVRDWEDEEPPYDEEMEQTPRRRWRIRG